MTATSAPEPATGPADVVIARFDAQYASRRIEIARRLEEDLQARLQEYGLNDITVKVVSSPVANEDEAQSLASESGSKVVIWGWYDDLGISVRVFLVGEAQARRDVVSTNDLPLELAGGSSAELAFVVHDVLPDNVSFLSLFVIGHLYYLANEYQAGHTALDAAMANIPETVALENEALLHFFSARELDAAGSDDTVTIICEYARAIELDPNFAEAYNNLGVAVGRELWNPNVSLPFGADECLFEAGLSYYDLFDKALELQPDWALAEYNKWADYWSDPYNRGDVGQAKAALEAVVQRDPSLTFAYVLLGNIALEQGDLDAAVSWYNSALEQDPKSAKLHFNLGELILRSGQEEQAKAEFQVVLGLDGQNPEAHLALANLALRQGEIELALTHLDAIQPLEREKAVDPAMQGLYPISPGAMAMILRSRAYFEASAPDSAIETLQTLVSKVGPWPVATPLEQYLLGLLYSMTGDAVRASQAFPGAGSGWEAPDQNSNASSAIAWFDIVETCAPLTEGGPEAWGTGAGQCLPTDLKARISAVYDTFQDRLPYRLYFQKGLLGVPACPYVFSFDASRQTWRWNTTILYGLAGEEREALQRRRLTQFNGRLLIREVEPEVSYIDQLYVLVADHAGQEVVLPASLPVLQEADGHYLILTQGDDLLLTFEDGRAVSDARGVWVVAKGYYVPLR
jgi:tetratricopeptide (TPR) repeat protein